jgi:hypothetical protein
MEQQLIKWMQEFVEVPHPALGAWAPCPFARQARVNNKIAIVKSDPGNLVNTVEANLQELETKEVVVVWFDHTQVDQVVLASLVQAYNKILMPHNYVVLEDHPDAEEYVNGVKMNFGLAGLLVVQKLDKLNTAADQLKSKGYYNNWDQAALDQVVNWRFK